MKIMHVIVGLDVGGAERSLCRLIAAHRNDPHYLHQVVSLTTAGALAPQLLRLGIEVDALGMKSILHAPITFWRLRRRMRAARPDLVQCWMYYADLLGGVAARSIGIRRVFWGVRNSYFEGGGTFLKYLVRMVCAVLSYWIPERVICVAQSARAIHVKAGYSPRKMQVVGNGYELDLYKFSADARLALRSEFGFGKDDLVIGSVGRYSAAKDHALLLRAASRVIANVPNARFLLIGRDLTAGNLRLTELICQAGLSGRVVLAGERSDVAYCMSAMDVFCLHSNTEGFPNVLGEAMCVGLPCVTTDVGDAAVLIGDTGTVVPPGRADVLAEALISLLTRERASLADMGLASRHRISSMFTLSRVVQQYESLYKNLRADQ